MTGAPGFLEFFILEASDYVEQLDGLLLGGGSSGPDPDALQRVARALRGTATMAKLSSFADVAAGLERIGRAMQEATLAWSPSLGGALVATVDDLKTLLHAARTWSPTEDQRANARSTELSRFAPLRTPAAIRAVGDVDTPASGSTFFATETANIAAGLELLTTRPGDRDTAANVLRRIRALRGVAGVKEIGPLADALEATEEAARGLEWGDEPLVPEARGLLESAAAYLRALSSALRTGGAIDIAGQTRDSFIAAQDAWNNRAGERDRVVPISHLFYSDGTPGLVQTDQNPPTSASERFRLELVSLGEHLRQVVDSARHATDAGSSARAKRDLRRALIALQAAAESFDELEVAAFIGTHIESTQRLDFLGLAALEDLAAMLADPGTQGERLRERVHDIGTHRDLTRSIGAGFGGAAPAPVATLVTAPVAPPIVAPTVATPVAPVVPPPVLIQSLDYSSADLIDSSIAALEAMNAHPFAEPVTLPEDAVVPIETLLYRGRNALDRAVEIRDDLRRHGATSDLVALEELFDLLELARAE